MSDYLQRQQIAFKNPDFRVQVGGIVARDARGKDMRLPGARRKLEPLELPDHLEQAVAPVELRARVDVLPAEEEAHQVGRGRRLPDAS